MGDGQTGGCNKFGPMRRLSMGLRESLLISLNLAGLGWAGLGQARPGQAGPGWDVSGAAQLRGPAKITPSYRQSPFSERNHRQCRYVSQP